MEIVGGFTQGDIEAARDAAGIGGTVFFPNGTYLVANLEAMIADQTWILDRKAIVQRSSGPALLEIKAAGLRLKGGTWDGGWIPGEPWSNGLSATGFGAEIEDILLQNISGWGIIFVDGVVDIRRSTVRKTGLSAIFASSSAPTVKGSIVEGCTVDRLEGYGGYAGVQLIAMNGGNKWLLSPRVINTVVYMPPVPNVASTGPGQLYQNAVGIEILNASAPVVMGCSVANGKIGISFGNARNGKMIGNAVGNAFQYGLEIAGVAGFGSQWCCVEGNSVNNVAGQAAGAAAPSRGVSISGASHHNKVIGNSTYWNSVNVGINPDCLDTTNQFNS